MKRRDGTGWRGHGDTGTRILIGTALAVTALVLSTPETFVLNTEIPIWDAIAEDLDGDGVMDILALCSDDESEPLNKYVAVFLTGGTGEYPAAPSAMLPLDPGAGTVFLAEVDGAAPKEVVVGDHASARAYRFADGRFEMVGETAFVSLLPYGAKEPVFLRGAAEDLDGDGVDEWLVPVPTGYEIHRLDGRVASIRCDVASELRNTGDRYIVHRLPAHDSYSLADRDRKDLVFLSDAWVDFAYGEHWQETTRFRVPEIVDEEWDSSAAMDDINGDGLPDLVVTRTKGTVNLTAVTHVYLAEGPVAFPEDPTVTIETKGALTAPSILDVNGDDELDLVFVSFPINIRSILSYFLRKRIGVRISVHYFEDGGYAEAPSHHQNFGMDAPEGREQVAFASGDFNGDGLLDAAFGSAKDELTIYAGDADDFLESRPFVELELPTFGIARHTDLNGNGNEDIVIVHPTGEHDKRIEVIVF